MRALLPLLGLPLGLALWGGSLWWSPPWGLSVRLEPRPVVQAPAPARDARLLRAEVTATYPRLEGLALGDAVQFDRYGVLAPTAGSVVCVPLQANGTVHVTPIGGRIHHAGSVDLTLVAPGAPGCESASLEPVVSVRP